MPRLRNAFWCLVILFFIPAQTVIALTETTTYQYDALGQLANTDYGATSAFFIYDASGNRLTQTVYPTGTINNYPPNAPSLIYPHNGASEIDTKPVLAWSGSDPDSGNILSYTIDFGEEGSLEPLRSGIYDTSFQTQQLKPNTTSENLIC